MEKTVTTSAASFSEWCKELERSASRKVNVFDEMGAFDKIFGASMQGSEAMSHLLSAFHRSDITRSFVDTDYASTIKKPFINNLVIAQPEIFTRTMSSHVPDGGVSRFLMTIAKYCGITIDRQNFSNEKLELFDYVQLDVIMEGLLYDIQRNGFMKTLVDRYVDNVRVVYSSGVDATLSLLELLV